MGSPPIETERLVLRPIAAEDEEPWWRTIWSDPEVTRFLPTRGPVPREAMARRMERVAEHWKARGIGVWSLRAKADGAFVGHAGLVIAEPPDVELIYALARAAWGRGLATEVAARLVAHAFEALRVERLTALVFPENPASVRVLEKVGFARRDRVRRFDADLDRYVLRGKPLST
jgi:ribosomal-protein-alanine N-acetyltransferase